jgi:hypothetical protein
MVGHAHGGRADDLHNQTGRGLAGDDLGVLSQYLPRSTLDYPRIIGFQLLGERVKRTRR